MSATIKDVAKRAGVSPATVSYVLNQSAPVSQRTRERVLQAIAALDYRPSYRGRSLRDKQSRTIGVVLPQPPDAAEKLLATPLLAGLTIATNSAGYHLLIASAPAASEQEIYHDLASTGRVDGMLILGPQNDDQRLMLLQELGLPHACLGRPPHWSKAPGAGRDLQAGALYAVVHLAKIGHQRIALIQPSSDQVESADWYHGYRQGLQMTGCSFQASLVMEGGPGSGSGYTAMEALLSRPDPPTAALVCTEDLALGAVAAAREAGITVGRDIALVASEDSIALASIEPPLSSLRWPERDIGHALGELLLAAIAGTADGQYIALKPQLFIRASSAHSRGVR